MEPGELASVKISGSGSASGGTYNEISISGSGNITGDAQANKVKVSGAASFKGSLKAESAKCSGSIAIAGDLQGANVKCSGSIKVGKSMVADALEVSGALRIDGGVKAKSAHVSGSASVRGDMEGESIRSDGVLKVDGLLSADKVEIMLAGHSRVREIGGENITIGTRIHNGISWGLGLFHRTGSLETDSIEGDNVHVEATSAGVVRGRRIEIGPNCRIDRIEYAESLAIDNSSNVNETSFTGDGPEPGIKHGAVQSVCGSISHGWRWIAIDGCEIRNPIIKVLAVVFGLGVAAIAVAFAMLAAGVAVGASLGGVVLILLLLVGAIPLLILVALVLQVVLIPFRLVAAVWRKR